MSGSRQYFSRQESGLFGNISAKSIDSSFPNNHPGLYQAEMDGVGISDFNDCRFESAAKTYTLPEDDRANTLVSVKAMWVMFYRNVH